MNQGPSWLGIGAQRCGTTWFTDLLIQHPRMDVAGEGSAASGGKKEHHQLYRYGLIHDWNPETRNEYRKIFSDDEIKLGEFTPYYLRASWICEPTADMLPADAPIIVLVRDPIDRFASALRHEMTVVTNRHRKASRLGNKLRARLVSLASLDVRRHQNLVQRLAGNIQEPTETFRDGTWLRFIGSDVSWGGMYAAQLSAWTGAIPKERFVVIQYEKLMEDPQRYADLVWSRLGLDPVPLTGIDRRSSSSTKGEIWRPEDYPNAMRALQQIYRPDAERLAAQFDIDLALWKRTMTDA
jgi:Sulfotransferase domain